MDTEQLLAQIETLIGPCEVSDTDKQTFREVLSTAPAPALESIIEIFSEHTSDLSAFIQNVARRQQAQGDVTAMQGLIEEDDRRIENLLTIIRK